jgi:NAD+ synthase (glutamine-hydrolysing)
VRTLRVALAQVNPTVGDLDGNARLIRDWVARAEATQPDLVAFPELCLTGYPPEDLVLRRAFVDANLRALRDVARSIRSFPIVVGFIDRDAEGNAYNAAAVLAKGKVAGIYHKVILPNYGVFDEKRYFTPGNRYPIFVIRGVHVGFSICEDAWIAGGPIRSLARQGAEVIVNINASPYHMHKAAEREELFGARARENAAWFLYVQTVGGQDELVFDGDSLAFDPKGSVVARGSQFEEELVPVDVSLLDRKKRLPATSAVTRLSELPRRPLSRHALPVRLRQPLGLVEEVYGALLLGTRDYLRKNGFRSAVIGLSGGIDSSLTAVIACDAVGADNVLGVAMPSEFSSPESLEDAKALTYNLGMNLQVIGIDEIRRTFANALAEAFADRQPDVTEENLQARIRGNLLMALSNKLGHIVLTTGNKSELATGYSTLYGDLAGGFAVIKDVPKTLVYELAQWRNERSAVIPDQVFTKPPSAELRPGQRDVDSLPPYEVLDPILHLYVEEDLSLPEIIGRGFDEKIVRDVARMVDLSEYKRRQAPPGVKITPRAFGRDRRLPITNWFREWAEPGPAKGEPGGPRAKVATRRSAKARNLKPTGRRKP